MNVSFHLPSAFSDNLLYIYLYGCFKCAFSVNGLTSTVFFVPCHFIAVPDDGGYKATASPMFRLRSYFKEGAILSKNLNIRRGDSSS